MLPERYDSWYDSPLGRFSLERESGLLRRAIGEIRGKSVLEVGCGSGRFLFEVATVASEVAGVDRDRAMLDVARRRAPARFTWIQADAPSLPLRDNSFDVVFESTVLCFHQDPKSILDEMVRICRPGGRVAIGELNPISPWQLWRRGKARFGIGYFRHAHWYAPRELMRFLEQAGGAPTFAGRAVFFFPISRPNLPLLCKGMETLGKRLWPCLGAYYAIAATKKE